MPLAPVRCDHCEYGFLVRKAFKYHDMILCRRCCIMVVTIDTRDMGIAIGNIETYVLRYRIPRSKLYQFRDP
jgi:hypothetical protein